ncbi:MAG: winged helix-turn-helix domain-containing protein, partial [Planctomycetaceae bacterium]|nr:winged helix-turn-helix domain-containing protein [Planctomycetaceae bacterium]
MEKKLQTKNSFNDFSPQTAAIWFWSLVGFSAVLWILYSSSFKIRLDVFIENFYTSPVVFIETIFLFFMSGYKLNSRQVKKLKKKHDKIKKSNPYIANRILIVLSLGKGDSASAVADRFLINVDTVRRYFSLYKEGGINGLLEIKYEGRHSFLTDAQKEQLKQHLRETIYLDVKLIIVYVRETFGIQYSISGMTKLLHSIGFEYKKPKVTPSKADPVEQQ